METVTFDTNALTDYMRVVKGGRCFNGAHRDRGQVVHLIPRKDPKTAGDWFDKALCGSEPGYRSYGWTAIDAPITCTKCLKILNSNPAAERSVSSLNLNYVPTDKS